MEQDYTKTIEAFFKSVYEHTDKTKALYKKAEEKQKIESAVAKIKDAEKLVFELINVRTTKSYDAKVLQDLVWKITSKDYGFMAFMGPNSTDNSALTAYRDVLRGISEYYGLPVQHKEKLLSPIKNWYYTTSTKKMKGFIYPFLPLKHFVIKDNTKGQK